jgi:hypothetical protein
MSALRRVATLVVILAALSTPRPARAQGLFELLERANAAEDSGRFGDAARAWGQLHEIAEGDPVPLYFVARFSAKAGDRATAVRALAQAIADGLVLPRPLADDTTLRALRTHPEWPALVRRSTLASTTRDSVLRRELMALAEADQRGRKGIDSVLRVYGVPSPQADSAFARMAAVDAPVQARLRTIVAERGWPGRKLVGDDAAHAAWLIAQHMEVAEQRRLLPLLQAAVRRGDARAADAALLEDRVGTDGGGLQRYGSQLKPPKPGEPPELYPIDKPECVDRRRAAVKLAPLASYLERMGVRGWRPPPGVACTERVTPPVSPAPASPSRTLRRTR